MSESMVLCFLCERVGGNTFARLDWVCDEMSGSWSGGCVFSCGIHMGTNMWIRYYTPQLILVFWCLHVLHSRFQVLMSLKSEVSQITSVEHRA